MRRRPAWVAGWAVVVFLGLFTAASKNRLADALTFPWYHLEARIVPNVAFFVPFFAGVTLAFGVDLVHACCSPFVGRPSRHRGDDRAACQFVGVHGWRADSAYIRTNFTSDTRSIFNQAFVGPTSLAAFRWLDDHATRRDTVAEQPLIDGSLWMYALEHVAPLLGAYDARHGKTGSGAHRSSVPREASGVARP